jgi:hypothetical protein
MKDMTEQLTGLDRLTLHLWRIGNVVGWSVAALLVSLFFRLAVEDVAAFFHHSFADSTTARDYVIFAFTVEMPASVLCGSSIGSLLGARVYRRPDVVAGAVSALYAAVLYLAKLTYPASGGERALAAASMLVAVPVSIWLARQASRSRPRALRRERAVPRSAS